MGLDCRLNEILPTVVEESKSFPFIKVIFIDLLQLKDIASKNTLELEMTYLCTIILHSVNWLSSYYLFKISHIQYDQKQK